VTIELLSIEGKILQVKKAKGAGIVSTKFEISDLSRGAYYLKITTNSGSITKKIIKK